MARVFTAAAVIIATLAALAEIGSFLLDKGGIIRDYMHPPEVAQRPPEVVQPPACRTDANPVARMLCEDKRDGKIRFGP